jgi:hypothetical protein
MHVIDFLPPEITHEPEWETEECDASAKELETEQSPQYVQHQQLITTEGAGDVGEDASETYIDQINLNVKTDRQYESGKAFEPKYNYQGKRTSNQIKYARDDTASDAEKERLITVQEESKSKYDIYGESSRK